MNFGFLFNSVYRFLFYCLMASVSWGYESLLGKITAGLLGATAVFNTFVICRYPSYRRQREKIAEEEDKRIQAKINQQDEILRFLSRQTHSKLFLERANAPVEWDHLRDRSACLIAACPIAVYLFALCPIAL